MISRISSRTLASARSAPVSTSASLVAICSGIGAAACSLATSRATRSENTSPSSSELDASRLAPCTPVQATSPAAQSPARDV